MIVCGMDDILDFQHKFRQSLQWRDGLKATNFKYVTPHVDTRQMREQQQQSSPRIAAIRAMAHPE